MKQFAIASNFGTKFCYDYVIYLTLKQALEERGYMYDKDALNRIYMMGFPLRPSYHSCGKYNPEALNIALTGSYFSLITLEELKKFNFIFCSSTYGHEYILKNHNILPDGLWNPYSPFGNATIPNLDLTDTPLELPYVDIGFVGNARRRPAIETLLPLLKKHPEWKFQWHGFNIQNYQGTPELKKYWSGHPLPYNQYPEFAKKTKIVLVDMHDEMSIIGSPSFKYIDHIMSGALVAAYRNSKYVNYMNGLSFNNEAELEALLTKYIGNEKSRITAQQAQYNLIKEVHSVKRTVAQLSGIIEHYGK